MSRDEGGMAKFGRRRDGTRIFYYTRYMDRTTHEPEGI